MSQKTKDKLIATLVTSDGKGKKAKEEAVNLLIAHAIERGVKIGLGLNRLD